MEAMLCAMHEQAIQADYVKQKIDKRTQLPLRMCRKGVEQYVIS